MCVCVCVCMCVSQCVCHSVCVGVCIYITCDQNNVLMISQCTYSGVLFHFKICRGYCEKQGKCIHCTCT